MKKLFILEITSDEKTRWSATDEDLEQILAALCTGAAKCWSNGPEPAVRVFFANATITNAPITTE